MRIDACMIPNVDVSYNLLPANIETIQNVCVSLPKTPLHSLNTHEGINPQTHLITSNILYYTILNCIVLYIDSILVYYDSILCRYVDREREHKA
jgi:hypothetical protein